MIKKKRNKVAGICFMVAIIGSVVVLGGVAYRKYFSPDAVIKGYLKNQFNYMSENIEVMQEKREQFLADELLQESLASGVVEEQREYAVENGECCELQDVHVEKTEDGSYFFEVWYSLRYDVYEVEDKLIHANGVMEVLQVDGFKNRISSMEVLHACEEVLEKEYKQ